MPVPCWSSCPEGLRAQAFPPGAAPVGARRSGHSTSAGIGTRVERCHTETVTCVAALGSLLVQGLCPPQHARKDRAHIRGCLPSVEQHSTVGKGGLILSRANIGGSRNFLQGRMGLTKLLCRRNELLGLWGLGRLFGTKGCTSEAGFLAPFMRMSSTCLILWRNKKPRKHIN